MKELIELLDILDTMDVPPKRKEDMRWLSRNLFIRNSKHPKFKKAMELIKTESVK